MEVRLEGLTKKFTETVAVDNMTVTFPSGKLTGLLGPSGCGKSTTLFMLAGLHNPTDGKIFFGEEDVTDLPPEKRGIGLVFQNYALYPHMTVEQNIMFPLENLKVPRKEAKQIAFEMAKLVHIEMLMNRKPSQLSGGQQQRVAIARALAKKPRILLLDEPLSNLDARLRLETREEIKRIQQETGITTIFVTHDQEEAMSISDQIIVMKEGIVQQVEEPQELYNEPINKFVAKFLGNPPINVLQGVVKNRNLTIDGHNIYQLNVPDNEIEVGIRPEAFMIDGNGFEIHIENVETIGRDTLIRFKLGKQQVRAFIDSEYRLVPGQNVKISLKRRGVHIFNPETGERIKYEK
ncbi:ABC transporter ATP-binding protein [Mycoplasmatota bacterium]|nr:ABC transporter ATP-binding protein [Mycoplasmatota bacterium]